MKNRVMAAIAGVGLAAVGVGGGCQSAGIAVKESVFGIAKRDQLVARVEDARKSHEDAKAKFATALEEFQSLTGVKPSELESKYKRLKSDYERCESAAGEVRSRIGSVQTVGEKLFNEWKGEVIGMSDPALKSANDQQMRSTRAQYDRLVAAMSAAEQKMSPVLTAFKDRVTFLKGALNAQAVASLNTTLGQVQSDVNRLITEMNASIAEADEFIRQMKPAE
jgi:Skp family chaperone for outer membrane proteins